MSSLTRRLQLRPLRRNKRHDLKIAVVSDAGKVVGSRWPRTKNDLFYTTDGRALHAGSKHPTLQPVIEAFAAREG